MYAKQQESQDWEVSADGLYIATRGYLVRRGYCCANRCRNCPYINWSVSPEWQPIPAEYVRRTRVSAKSVAGAYALLQHHEQLSRSGPYKERTYHREQADHYRMLLDRWGANREKNV